MKQARIWRKYGDETKYHFDNPDIKIGDYTYGVPDVVIYDLGVKLRIGKYCSIAKNVTIMLGGEHNTSLASQYPFGKRRDVFTNAFPRDNKKSTDVTIGNDVWIGRSVLILSGITIGDGAVIGAGAVVSKDIPPYSIAVGNPIRIIKYRFSPDQISQLLNIKWWNFKSILVNNLIPECLI